MFGVLLVAEFALQAVLRLEEGLAGRPVALLEAEARRAPLIAACTPAAAAAAVTAGMTVPQALARCPALVVRAPHPGAEAEARAALLAAAFSLSPALEATGPGICTVSLGGLSPDRREPALRAALADLAAAGLHASAGLAHTPLLALYAARGGAGVQVVRDGRAFLAPLPLAAAEPSPPLAQIVAGWGIRTLGEFAALPKADILQRLGAEGLALWERCAGETTRPLTLAAPARVFSAAFESEHPLETLEPLLFLLRRLVDRLALELQQAAFAARDLNLLLTLEDESVHAHTLRLPQPTHRAEILFRALVTYLEHLRTAAAVTGIGLAIEPTRILQRQEGLFDSALRDPHGFSESLARAAALAGAGRVGRPALENTHRPDAFRLEAPPEVLSDLSRTAEPAALRCGLALRRCRPPVPAAVELDGRAPAYLWARDVRGRVQARLGPWYGSGDWWQADTRWEREDWDVELDGGGLYRLFRTPAGWFLEGEYD